MKGVEIMGRHDRNNQPQPIDFNALGQLNFAQLFQILGSMDINQLMAMLSQVKIDPNDPNNLLKEDDPRIGLLYSLKPFLPPENAYIIDEIVKGLTGKK
ncbi:hypothetical protein [Fonticella tunisiensis]|nr:hypothetical protein [Fonticella tunisiensis]